MVKTYNFKFDIEEDEVVYSEHRDYRNGIICCNSTMDLQCYLNYIEYLNMHRDKWKTNGYLDLGLMPFAMGPSFMHNVLQPQLLQLAKILGVSSLLMPAVSLMYDKPIWTGTDIWLYKDEVAKRTGIPESKLTLEKLLRWCMNREVA